MTKEKTRDTQLEDPKLDSFSARVLSATYFSGSCLSIIYPDLEVPQNLSQKKRHKDVSKWSKEMARDQEAGDQIAAGLEEKKVNFNYKYLIPSQLKSHIEDHRLYKKV